MHFRSLSRATVGQAKAPPPGTVLRAPRGAWPRSVTCGMVFGCGLQVPGTGTTNTVFMG